MLATVDSLVPLSLLEAVKDIDTPADILETEFVDELRNKRLGLSDTIYAQIRRHSEGARRGQRIAQEEPIALARLIGRRPDSETVFRAAGYYLARQAYRTRINPVTRRLLRLLPAAVAKPMALRRTQKIAHRYLNGNVRRVGNFLLLEVPRSVTLDGAPGGAGCAFYEATIKEFLRLVVGSIGSVEHTRCAGRAEGTCEWRADWRSFDRNAGLE